MTLSKSQILLLLASLVTLYLTWAAYQDEPATIALPTRTLAPTGLLAKFGTDKADFNLQTSTQERALVPLTSDLFAPPKIEPEPPTYAAVKPPPPPVAPPLPFKYLGRWQDADKSMVMIDYQGEVIAIKAGDIVANKYKVVSINESASSVQIQFLMIPLNQLQTMQARAGQP
jgi:hypothetical protein